MSDTLRPARLDWSQGIPFASDFGDVYFSRAGGPAETCHVFLQQNRLFERLPAVTAGQGFTLVETGFGTGLNCLATLDLWRRHGGDGWLHYASVEKFPLAAPDLARAQACWPEFAELARELQRHYPPLLPGFHRICLPEWRLTLTLFFGDVADFLPRLAARVDAWYLDGFAPARNPAMWNEDLYQGMARRSAPGASFATFTAAGAVRRGLAAAGFAVERIPGFGPKREMLRGELPAPAPVAAARPWLQRSRPLSSRREACVIGAGIAGAQTAQRLARRGWQVTVLEQEDVAAGASGNPAAVVYGRLAGPGKAPDHFSQQAWLFALQELARWPGTPAPWHPCGVLQLATGNQAALVATLAQAGLPPEVARAVSAAESSEIAGVDMGKHGGLFYPAAGWLEAERYCRQLLEEPGIRLRTGIRVAELEWAENEWRLRDAQGREVMASPVVIVATAGAATRLRPLAELPLNTIRGQISLAPASAVSAPLKTVVCHDGYISPVLPQGIHCLGATFQPDCHDTAVTREDHEDNRRLLAEALPELAASLPPEDGWRGRAALRCQSPDYLPLVGPVADAEAFRQAYAGLRDGKVGPYPDLPALPGLYVNLAHGSKGFSQAALAAEILVSEINGEPAPVSTAVLEALHPMRFLARALRRNKP